MFQAKLEYGFDMNDQLAKQAVGVLNYEIDTEIVNLLDTTAGVEDADLIFNKALPVGVSKQQHYQGFMETFEAARTKIYNRTRRFVPNYMVCARDVIQVLAFVEGWKPSSNNAKINGQIKL